MKGNLHVRFCSRVMMVTSWLRQRGEIREGRDFFILVRSFCRSRCYIGETFMILLAN